MRALPALLSLLCCLCLSARAASAQEPLTAPPTPAAAALCATFQDADPVSKDACWRACTRWPIDTSCSILRRFGHDGWATGGALIQAMQQGNLPDWPTISKKHPYLREALEFYAFPPGVDPPWRDAPTRALVKQAIDAMMRADKLNQAGDYTSGLELAQDAERLLAKALGPHHPITAVAINNAAHALWQLGRYEDAAAAYKRAGDALTASLGAEHPMMATIHNNLAMLHESMGLYPAGLQHIDRAIALALLLQGPDDAERPNRLNNRASLLYRLGRLHEARADALQALQLAEQRPQRTPPQHISHILGNLATTHIALGDPAAARRYRERALRHAEATLGKEHPDTATSLVQYAILLVHLNDPDLARTHMERARAIRAKTLGPNHPDYAATLYNLAEILQIQGQHQEAATLAAEAMTIRVKTLGKDHPDVASSLNQLAQLFNHIGENQRAMEAYQQALAIEERRLGATHPALARTVHNLGMTQLAMRQFNDALTTLARGVALRKADQAAQGEELAEQLLTLAVARHLAKKGDPWPDLAAAMQLRQRAFWRAVEAADSDVQLLALTAAGADTAARFIALAWQQGRAQEVWEALLEREGRAAHAERARRAWQHLLATRPKKADKAWDAWRSADAALDDARAHAAARPSPDAAASVLRAAEALQRADKTLDKAWPARRAWRATQTPTAANTCATLRAEQAAMIHWLRQPLDLLAASDRDARWLALVVTPNAKSCDIKLIDLGAAAPIDDAITTWRQGIDTIEQRLAQRKPAQQAHKALFDASAALHGLVWQPLHAALGATQRAYLVPSGALNEVALGALVDPEGRALAERLDLVYLPIPASLSSPIARTHKPGQGALVLGALDFAAQPSPAAASLWERCQGSGCAAAPQLAQRMVATRGESGRACGWQALGWPKVGAEAFQVAEALGKRWRGQDVWLITGAGAQQAALEQAMPGKRVLHFGTHGFFAPAKGCQGQLQHTRAGLTADAAQRAGVDPMQLSALVLSGADAATPDAPSHQDGALTAREIVALDLSAVEVATLAACETGRGEQIAGEGAQGLSKAFVVAGVREVIVSLWQVPDAETTRLMQDLYASLPATHTPGQAARALLAAQRKLAGELRAQGAQHNVFLWAAFIPIAAEPAFSNP